ncbi:response regulator transcription factor [Catenulispora sp. NF23]|uniref:response regulator transcription factor n=1 Tax=Catenulispora pinistramenti TaxID=2705254 RepID=UPI001BAA088B|nr:response regulator transcription factor [Catenulispora pinistramenti]MBS2534407.1 response regulator transcription factor [Catenulispora pinistramenti]
MRVLVVEDETLLADTIAEGLRDRGFAVDVVYDGQAALDRQVLGVYDVAVLDRDLPRVHGDEVCRAWTSATEPRALRILMLTAASAVPDRVAGLELGADDYLGKPFAFAELAARVRALGRRTRAATPPVLTRAGVRLDPARREVTRDDMPIRLSPKEFAVLEELLLADGAVIPTEWLLDKAWDENADPFTNAVRVTMTGLRRKLGVPWVIETVQGVGYRIP